MAISVCARVKNERLYVQGMELPVELATLGGAMIKIDKTTDGDVLVAGKKVIKPDIMASNGIIHGIDGIITDPAQDPQ